MTAGLSLTSAQPPPSLPVVDTLALVKDPADGTKRMRIDVGAVATATTRVLSMGDRDVNLAVGGTFAELSHTHAASQITAGTFGAGSYVISGQLDVDNLRLDGNTVSSTDANGNIVLSPNGTGAISLVKKTAIDTGSGTLPSLIVATTALQIGGADSLGVGIQGDAFAGTGMTIYGRAASGTRASPTATNGQILLNLLGYGHNGTSLTTSPAARYQMLTPSTWSGTNNETAHQWQGTPNGSTTAAEWMRLVNAGLTIGATALVGSERLRVAGGTIATPGSTDVCAAAGIVAAGTEYRVGATKVVEARKTGWGAPTGTPTRTTFATGSVTLSELAERVKALIDDLTTHGLIGT